MNSQKVTSRSWVCMLYVHSAVVRLSMEVCNGGQLWNVAAKFRLDTQCCWCAWGSNRTAPNFANTPSFYCLSLCSALHSLHARQSNILTDIYILHLFRPLRPDASSVCVCVPFMLLLLLSVIRPPWHSKLYKEDRLMPLSCLLSYMLTCVHLITRKWRAFMKRATDYVINAF
jgi:hypothetical protein